MSWETFERNFFKGPIIAILSIGLIIIVSTIVLSTIWKPFSVISKVTETDKIIYNYEYFHNQHESFRSIMRKLEIASLAVERFKQDAGERANWTYEDKIEHSRLVSISDGLQYQCNDVRAEYNSRAKQITRTIFKSGDTPYQLGECNT